MITPTEDNTMPLLDLNVDNWALVESYNTPESAPAHQDIISLIDYISNANVSSDIWEHLTLHDYVN